MPTLLLEANAHTAITFSWVNRPKEEAKTIPAAIVLSNAKSVKPAMIRLFSGITTWRITTLLYSAQKTLIIPDSIKVFAEEKSKVIELLKKKSKMNKESASSAFSSKIATVAAASDKRVGKKGNREGSARDKQNI